MENVFEITLHAGELGYVCDNREIWEGFSS